MSAMYNKAIRMVHPDINPELKNAHDLSVLVNNYKHDDRKLEQFVNTWQTHGFDADIQKFINNRVNPSARPQGLTVSIRDRVKIPTNKKKMPYLEGIIIKLSRVTRGKLYGWYKITVAAENGTKWNYKCRNYDNITVTGRATIQEYYEAKNKVAQPQAAKPSSYDFLKVGLRKNTKYWTWRNVKVYAVYNGREYEVYNTGHMKVWLRVPGKKSLKGVMPSEITSSRRVEV